MVASKLTAVTFGLSAGLLVLFLVLSWLLWSSAMTWGILLGGVAMLANLFVLRWSLGWTLRSGPEGQGAQRFLVAFGLKLCIFAVIFGLALWSGRVHPLGLVLGCSVVVGAILLLAPVLGFVGLTEEEDHGSRRN